MRAAILFLLVVAVVSTMAQRSPYAPRPVGYPDVLNRFKGDEDDLPNRVGGTNSTQDQGPLQNPAGTIGDPYLLQQVPKWPREHQPFWYLNQQHIMSHRGQTGQQGQATGQQGQANRQQGQATGQQGQANRQQGQATGQQGQGSRQQGQVTGQQGQATRQQGQVTRQQGQPSRQQGTQANSQQGGQ